MGKRCSVLSSPLHSKHARCPQHKDRSSVAVALHPAPILADLRKTCFRVFHSGSRPSTTPKQMSAHTPFPRLKPAPTHAQTHGPSTSVAGILRRSLGAACPQSRGPFGGLEKCPAPRRFSSKSQAWRTTARASRNSPRFKCNLLGADALCSWLLSGPRSRTGHAVWREREPDRQTLGQDLSGTRDTPGRRHADSPR